MLVGLCGMFDERLSPQGRPLCTDAALPFQWIASPTDRLPQLFGRFDPGNYHSISAAIERPLDQSTIQLCNPHESDGVAANRRAQVLHDVLPVEMTMLGIDHDKIEARGNS